MRRVSKNWSLVFCIFCLVALLIWVLVAKGQTSGGGGDFPSEFIKTGFEFNEMNPYRLYSIEDISQDGSRIVGAIWVKPNSPEYWPLDAVGNPLTIDGTTTIKPCLITKTHIVTLQEIALRNGKIIENPKWFSHHSRISADGRVIVVHGLAQPAATGQPQREVTWRVTLPYFDPIPEYYSADFNRDHNIGQDDFGYIQGCLSGSGNRYTPECYKADFDGDGDVDSQDMVTFIKIRSIVMARNVEP